MMDWLEALDRSIVLTVNGWNHPVLDEIMWLVSGKLTWFPFYLLILFLFWKKSRSWKQTLVFVMAAIAAVGLSDFISSQIIKESVMRYRPSHHALLTSKLHFYTLSDGEVYKGGMYGFVSSHAANFFAICTFVYLVFREWYKKSYLIFLFAILVCFSRLYLGVHYLSDLLCGAALGSFIAWAVYRLGFTKLRLKWE